MVGWSYIPTTSAEQTYEQEAIHDRITGVEGPDPNLGSGPDRLYRPCSIRDRDVARAGRRVQVADFVGVSTERQRAVALDAVVESLELRGIAKIVHVGAGGAAPLQLRISIPGRPDLRYRQADDRRRR